jgi:hypothetical protein
MRVRILGGMAAVIAAGWAALPAVSQEKTVPGLILQFNGKSVGEVEAKTKNKAFRPVFEKELAKLAAKLDGKPDLKISHWYTIINGCAIRWTKGDDRTAAQTKAALEKLPYVKSVEFDQVIKIDLPKK